MVRNADGSTDIYIGPKAPDGQEANWIPVHLFLWFRFYGPQKAFLDKSWRLPELERFN